MADLKNSEVYGLTENQMADILSQDIDYEGIAKEAASSESLAKEVGSLTTWRDNADFENFVASDLTSFEANQGKAMVSAANILGNSELASETASRKIENLQQQKALNDQMVATTGKFMKALAMPPVVGDIIGLFDSDYSIGTQMKDLATQEAELKNLQTQSALDDQLLLQQAFGEAGYNQLANEVIQPARDWEKQYADEQAALQRNKVSAASNKLAAKNAKLDAFKALNTRLGTLQDIRHDAISTANQREAIANQRYLGDLDMQRTQLNVSNDLANRAHQRALANEENQYRWVALSQNAANKATDLEIAQMARESAKERSLATSESNQVKAETNELTRQRLAQERDKLAFEQAKFPLELQAKTDYTSATKYVADKGVEQAMIKQQTQKMRSATAAANAGSAGGKPLTAATANTLIGSVSEATAKADHFSSKVETLAKMNNGLVLNSPVAMDSLTNFNRAYAALNQLKADAGSTEGFNQKINSDLGFANRVTDLTKSLDYYRSQAESDVASLFNPTGDKSEAAITDLRVNYNGVIPAQNRPIASNYVITNGTSTANASTIEGQLGRALPNEVRQGLIRELTSLKASTNAAYKAKLKELTGDSGDINQLSNNELVQLLVAGKSAGGSAGVSEGTLKSAVDSTALINDILTRPYVSSRQSDPNDTRSIYQRYRDNLFQDYSRYSANAILEQANASGRNPSGQAIVYDFSTDSEPISHLAMLFGDNGYTQNEIASLLKSFGNANSVQNWGNDYLNRTVGYDNAAAALVPVLGFYDIVANMTAGTAGYASDSYYNENYKLATDKALAVGGESANSYATKLMAQQAINNYVTTTNSKGK